MSFNGCISCRKCEFIRGSAFCGADKLTEKQLYNDKGYCSDFENKAHVIHQTINGETNHKEVEALDMAIKALEQEPCEDCISRQAVLEYIEASDAELGHSSENELVCQDIKELPPVTPQTKIGWWITEKVDGGYKVYCSKCKGSAVFEYVHDGDIYSSYGHGVVKKTKYCPDCGTKMIPQPYCAE